MSKRRIAVPAVLLAGTVLFLSLLQGCASPPRKKEGGVDPESRQIRVLREISRMEARIRARIEALPQVEKALVKVRPGKALILVAPAGGKNLDPEVVEKIKAVVLGETGLEERDLVMRRWGKAGGRK